MPSGPFGLPRLTSLGPLVSGELLGFSQEIRNEDELRQEMLQIMEENNIGFEDPSDEDLIIIAEEMIGAIYPPDNPVDRAKNVRMKNCLANDWSSEWVEGLAENTNTVPEGDVISKLFMQMRGHIGVTESNVADDERLIPDQFKE